VHQDGPQKYRCADNRDVRAFSTSRGIVPEADGMPAQSHIPVGAESQNAVFPATPGVASEILCKIARLAELGFIAINIQDLLNGDRVRIQLSNNSGNAVRPDPPINSTAFVNVVGGNPDSG